MTSTSKAIFDYRTIDSYIKAASKRSARQLQQDIDYLVKCGVAELVFGQAMLTAAQSSLAAKGLPVSSPTVKGASR
jgi:hypothetical protein